MGTVTTWAAALADDSVLIHWLLELTSGDGTVARFADDDLEVDGVAYTGALAVDNAPRIEADPYDAAASSQGARVSLLPVSADPADSTTTRPYDLEELYNAGFLQFGARLYRWAEGTPASERDLVLDGYVESASLDTDGELSLEIVDLTVKYDRRFPRYTLDKDVFDYPYEDDLGGGYALLYGTFTRIPCPVHNTNDNRALIGEGDVSALSQAYLNDSAIGTESLGTGLTDSREVAYCRVNVGAAIGDSEVTVSGTGYVDDADGTYTGTASAAFTHPADMLHHLARTYAEIPAAKVDANSFVALRDETPGYVGAIQVLADDRTSFFDVCEEACKYLRAVVMFERGKLIARRLDFNRPAALRLTDEVTLREVSSIEWGDKSNLLSKLTVRYNWGWRKKRKTLDFKSSLTLDADNYAPFAQALAFVGTEEREMTTKMIADDTTMESAIAGIAEVHSKVRKQVTVRATRAAHDLRIYDVVELTTALAPSTTGAGWTEKRFIVTGIQSGTDDNLLTLLEV